MKRLLAPTLLFFLFSIITCKKNSSPNFYSAAPGNGVMIDTVAATDAGTASGPVFKYEPDVVISGSQTDFTNGGGGYALCVAGSGFQRARAFSKIA